MTSYLSFYMTYNLLLITIQGFSFFSSLDVRFAMDELSVLVLRQRNVNEPIIGQVSYELVIFDFLKLHPFIDCCAHCEKSSKDLKRCIRCHQANYCSPQCRRKDWKNHKVTCTSTTPSTN